MGASINFSKYLQILPIVILQVHAFNTALYGYTTYDIEADQICTRNELQPHVLDVKSKSGLIVKDNNFVSTSGRYLRECSFIVDASVSWGIIAVAQEMKLRKDEYTGDCIDYVQFRHSNYIRSPFAQYEDEPMWGPEICGELNSINSDLTSFDIADTTDDKLLNWAFMDPAGKMEVKIHISDRPRSPDIKLHLKIAFVAYQPCSKVPSSLFKKCNPSTCIWGDYFGDKVFNCPFTTCADEGGCQVYSKAGSRSRIGLGTIMLVGGVVCVFTMVVVIIMCLCLFRCCASCQNSPPTNAQNTTQMRPMPAAEAFLRPMPAAEAFQPSAEAFLPTAPPGSPSMDKDQPPSYEVLFAHP